MVHPAFGGQRAINYWRFGKYRTEYMISRNGILRNALGSLNMNLAQFVCSARFYGSGRLSRYPITRRRARRAGAGCASEARDSRINAKALTEVGKDCIIRQHQGRAVLLPINMIGQAA